MYFDEDLEEVVGRYSNYNYSLFQKLKDIIIISIYSFTDKLYCQMNTVTALLLELLRLLY